MKEETKGTIYICDACDFRTFVSEIDTPPEGLHFNVMHVYAGGNAFEFYSCKTDVAHVKRAFERGWKRYMEEEEEVL